MMAADSREVMHFSTITRWALRGLGLAILLACAAPASGQEIVRPSEFWLLRPQPILPMPQTMAPMNVQPLLLPPIQRPANNPQGLVIPNQMPQYMQPQGWWQQNHAFDMSAYKNTARPDLMGGAGFQNSGGSAAASRRPTLGW